MVDGDPQCNLSTIFLRYQFCKYYEDSVTAKQNLTDEVRPVFDGNPPYQEVVVQKESSNSQKVGISIFQYFQTISDRLGRYTSLIYPGARWIHRLGKGLEQFGLS